MFIKDGIRFNIYAPHVIDDVQYPPEHFRSPQVQVQFGISEVFPERKDERYYFVQETDEAPYVINTPKPLASVKDNVWEMIKNRRDELQVAGVLVSGHWFHNDIKSRSQWERMANNAEKLIAAGAALTDPYTIGGQPVPWKTMTGEYVPLTLGFIRSVVEALEVQEATIFKIAATHEATMRVRQNVDAVAAYDFTGGWPAVYVPEVVE